MSLLGLFLLEVVAIVLELSYAGDSFCCPMTFSLRLCHLKAYFLELCSTIPLTFNVSGACGYICFVTLGLGRGLRFAFVSFCKWVSYSVLFQVGLLSLWSGWTQEWGWVS